MREELNLFGEYLKPDYCVAWEIPIAFLLERTPLHQVLEMHAVMLQEDTQLI